MRQSNADKIFADFVSWIHEDGVDRRAQYRAEYDQYPPIHITTGSSFRVARAEDLERHTKEGTSSRLVLYGPGDDGKQLVEETEIRLDISQDYEGYPFVVSVPAALRDAASVDTLRAIIDRELESLAWLLPHL